MKKYFFANTLMALSFTLLIGITVDGYGDVSPAQWLGTQVKPAFRAGYTLPRLTRYGWQLPVDTRIELTENWGYALEFSGYVSPEVVTRLDDPYSAEAIVAAKTKSDPARYPLSVICDRRLPETEAPIETWTRDSAGKIISGSAQSMDGTPWGDTAAPVYSPEAPDTVWKMAGEYRAAPFRALQARGVPISIVLNGGEYGINVIGWTKPAWERDPHIVAAVNAEYAQGGDWRTYISKKKANAEHIIASAVRAAVPQRDLYVYYTAGGVTLRNTYWGIDDWGYYWKDMRGVGDLPSNEAYYRSSNEGFTGKENMLALVLNAVSAEIASGNPLSYNWVCAGWPRGDEARNIANIDRWTGFLKCYYTAGMLGANVGYYDFPPGGFDATFPDNAPPAWLQQMVASAHVHALFSYVETFVRESDLLPGPMQHSISTSDPAYEFPTGDETARVLVRKHRTNNEWLLTAWAADGADRPATITVPLLGQITLQARAYGSVYRASLTNGMVSLVRLDDEGSTFTHASSGTPVVTPANLSVALPTSVDRLLWLSADAGVTADAEGKVSAWTSYGTPALTMQQSNVANRPSLVANAIDGKPALRFNNSQYWLENHNLAGIGDSFTGALTMFAVFTGAIVDGDNRIIAGARPGGADWLNGQGFKITDGITNSSELKNGIMLKIVSGSLDTALVSLFIGVMGAGYTGFTGDLAEVIMYKGHLPETKSSLIRVYLHNKYHLTSLPTGFKGKTISNVKSISPMYTMSKNGGMIDIKVRMNAPVRSIDLVDASGRTISRQTNSSLLRIHNSSARAGVCFVRAQDITGKKAVFPLVIPR